MGGTFGEYAEVSLDKVITRGNIRSSESASWIPDQTLFRVFAL